MNLLPIVILSKILSIATDSTVQIKASGNVSKYFNAAVKICLGENPPYRTVVFCGEEIATSKAVRYYFDLATWNTAIARPFIPFGYVCQLMTSLPIWESIRNLWPRDVQLKVRTCVNKLLNSFPVPDHHHDGFKGFLIECRPTWNGSAIGVWKTNVPNTKTLPCANLQDVSLS